MKRAVSPVTVETEDGVTETIEIIQQDEKKLRTENDELMIDEGVVYEEEVIQPQQPPPQYQNLIIQHMDIAEPLSTLKKLLEVRLQCCLGDHLFFLQDSIQLDENKSLVDQCVQGEGMVQINLEVKSQPGVPAKINILDILKTAEELEEDQTVEEVRTVNPPTTQTKSEEPDNITRWIVDQNFRREQERLKIPYDPFLWSEVHVKHWIQWAIKEFDLHSVMPENFALTGKQLCELTHPAFIKLIPHDPGDIFWTHLELLRKCKFVAVMQQPTPQAITTITVSTSDTEHRRGTSKSWRPRSPRITGDERLSPGNRTGNNGQIQLWQFLLELLTDKDCREIIMWVGDDGEFKLNNPEMVAQMWGQRKNKPTMNYEKLSRALRYYYDGDMIAKVHGKRFVYKFVCDLKMLLGYNAGELNRLVSDCVERKLHNTRESVRAPMGIRRVVEQKTQTVQTI